MLDAVEKVALAIESVPVFDARTGAYLNQGRVVQLDALIIDGRHLNFGAVVDVMEVKKSIRLARKIMEETDQRFFVGEGASRQAEGLGIPRVSNEILVTPAVYQYLQTNAPMALVIRWSYRNRPNDNVAAAVSTSGTRLKPTGRVGDFPFFGSGDYAANGIGAAGATGQDEQIMRTLLSKYAWDRLADNMSAKETAEAITQYFERVFPVNFL